MLRIHTKSRDAQFLRLRVAGKEVYMKKSNKLEATDRLSAGLLAAQVVTNVVGRVIAALVCQYFGIGRNDGL